MTWSFDISAAPLGEWVTTAETRKGKDGKTELVESKEYRHEWVWLFTKCLKKVRTRWLPPSRFNAAGRWDGLATGEVPIAWHPYIVPDDPVMPGQNFESQAKASVDNAATSAPGTAPAGREMQVGAEPRGSVPATSEGGRDSVERHAPNSQETATETMGGTGDDCSFGNRGVWPPQDGASSSRGNDSLSVVTGGESAANIIVHKHIFLDDVGSGA